MTDDRGARRTRWSAIAAVLLLIAAVLYLGLFQVVDAVERHAFNSGWLPKSTVQLSAGKAYHISVRGGAEVLSKRGEDLTFPQCWWSTDRPGSQSLTVTPVAADSHSLNVVASFVAPVTGPVHVECPPWGAVSVDDSDDSAVDLAGFFLLLAVVCLTAGAALGLSLLRRVASGPPARHAQDGADVGN
ncbi:MAG: hypothetical protein ABJB98_01590 [Actinomycetota bacterium]